MIRWRIRSVLVCALILVSLTVIAQEEQQIDLTQPLTLEQCIQLAIENSTDMRNARINLAIDGLRVKDARAGYYPDIFLSGRYSFSDALGFGFERENYDLGVGGQYTLWDNGQREANFSQAKELRNATINRNEQTKQNLIFKLHRHIITFSKRRNW